MNRIRRPILIIITLLAVYGFVASAQVRPANQSRIIATADGRDPSRSEEILREMKRTAPEAFSTNNYDYLLARLLEQRGANAEALPLYQQVVARNSLLAGYALWHEAEIARRSGNPNEEQKLLQRLIAQYPDHLLRPRAIERLSESYLKSGQYQAVIDTLKTLGAPRRDSLAMIGEAQMALRQMEAARASFSSVLTGGLMDDASLRAVTGLDRLDQAALMAPGEIERLQRARIYQFNRHFADARRHWLSIVKDFPQSERRGEAIFQLGRGYFQEDRFAEAIPWYEKAHDEFPQSDEGEQGFYYVGHCHQYLGDANRAISRYEEFLKTYPDSEYAGYAHLNAIDTLRSAGRPAEALNWAARAQSKVREPFFVVTALFNQARIHLTQENYPAALADLTALKTRSLSVRGLSATTNPAEVGFIRGYCLEKLGRFDEAVGEYLALGPARSGSAGYYSHRAGERLKALALNPRARNMIAARRDRFRAEAQSAYAQGNAAAAKTAATQALRFEIDQASREEMLKILRSAYARLRNYQLPALGASTIDRPSAPDAGSASRQNLAGSLLFLGLYDEGASELTETQASRPTIAYYCARGECASRTVKYSEPILNSLPEDYQLELLPREWAEVFYPVPFRDALARHAASRNVDPLFVLSIARQETRYETRVKSPAAARGMFQFISSTANRIADQLRIYDFAQSDLYDPETAILFGSQYLKNLFDEFDSPEAVAAAYNGSEDSVRRWQERARSHEVDRLVIEIAKRETKEYVFNVMNFYRAYQEIYSEKK